MTITSNKNQTAAKTHHLASVRKHLFVMCSTASWCCIKNSEDKFTRTYKIREWKNI